MSRRVITHLILRRNDRKGDPRLSGPGNNGSVSGDLGPTIRVDHLPRVCNYARESWTHQPLRNIRRGGLSDQLLARRYLDCV